MAARTKKMNQLGAKFLQGLRRAATTSRPQEEFHLATQKISDKFHSRKFHLATPKISEFHSRNFHLATPKISEKLQFMTPTISEKFHLATPKISEEEFHSKSSEEFHCDQTPRICEEFTAAAWDDVHRHRRYFRTGFGHLRSAVEKEQAITDKEQQQADDQSLLQQQQQRDAAATTVVTSGLPATTAEQKPRLVVLGSGWGACRLLKDIDMRLYDVVCVSPRNHMVFTPLLASTCVGTLEFRSVAEPVRSIQPALSVSPNSNYFLARCTAINTEKHEVHCEALRDDDAHDQEVSGKPFTVAYDKLVIATGAEASTFGIKGVHEHAIFLRDVKNAMDIRTKLLLNLMKCEIPGTSLEEKSRLLHCVVVGGGPTGVEFSGELSDFIGTDVHRKFAHVQDLIHVTLVEANEILSSFDVRLREYAIKQLTKTGVRLKRGMVKDVLPEKLLLTDGTEVPYGLLVWSTGVGPSPFVRNLQFEKSPGGRIGVEETLRVPGVEDVYAIGDCSGYLERTNKSVLPALAQVAERQGKYIAKALNKLAKEGAGHAGAQRTPADPFVYRHLGSMATVGRYKALVDLRESNKSKGLSMTGFLSWIVWRSAYLTRVISWRNRLYVAVNWGTTFLFGRDISCF